MARTKVDTAKKSKPSDEGTGDHDSTENSDNSKNQEKADDDIVGDVIVHHEETASTSAQHNDGDELVIPAGSEVGAGGLSGQGKEDIAQGGSFETDPNIQMMLMLQNQAYMQQLAFMNQFGVGDQSAEAAAAGEGADSGLETHDSGLKQGKMADILRGLKAKIEDKTQESAGERPQSCGYSKSGF